MPFTRKLVLILALAAAPLALAACGSSSSSSSPSSAGSATPKPAVAQDVTYSNPQYHFALTHSTVLTQGPPTTDSGSGPVFTIVFANTKGTTVQGSYEDGLKVDVGKMDSAVTAAQVPLLKTQFAANMRVMLNGLAAAKIAQPMHLVHRHGLTGFEVAYDFEIGSVPFHGVTDILLKGHNEYQVTGQASQKTWATIGPQLQAAVASFRPV